MFTTPKLYQINQERHYFIFFLKLFKKQSPHHPISRLIGQCRRYRRQKSQFNQKISRKIHLQAWADKIVLLLCRLHPRGLRWIAWHWNYFRQFVISWRGAFGEYFEEKDRPFYIIVFAYFSASNNCADNICNLSGSNFMAISILSSIILVWQELDGRQKKWKKWFKKNLLVS